jgi:hypothetical protein
MGFIWRPWELTRDNLKLGKATLCESPTFNPLHGAKGLSPLLSHSQRYCIAQKAQMVKE